MVSVAAIAFVLGGCATSSVVSAPANREAISREMPLVVEYEGRRNEVKKAVSFLALNGLLDSASGKEVKESLDIEYVYYEASIISLARGDMKQYRSYVALAGEELDRAKSVVLARMNDLHQQQPKPQTHIPPAADGTVLLMGW
jgi:hypothetical protein